MTDQEMVDAFLAVDGIPIDPQLPAAWDSTPHQARPDCHHLLWDRPYIETDDGEGIARDRWLDAWPSGTRYNVRCLDGGAWDRSTNHGMFKSLAEAMAVAEALLQEACP